MTKSVDEICTELAATKDELRQAKDELQQAKSELAKLKESLVPAGWALCDGQGGRPNQRARVPVW